MSRDARSELMKLILFAVEICRLIMFRAYVNRETSLNDTKMNYKVCPGSCFVVSDLLYSVLKSCGSQQSGWDRDTLNQLHAKAFPMLFLLKCP